MGLKQFLSEKSHRWYKLLFTISAGCGRLWGLFWPARNAKLDIVFVVPKSVRGWILEAIAQEISLNFAGKTAFHYSSYLLPRAKSYFFAYYGMVPHCLKFNPHIHAARLSTWYTHPKDQGYSEQELIDSLNLLSKVFVTCSLFREHLITQGVEPQRVEVVLGAAEPLRFIGHQRGNGTVGFCSAFYERKDPDRILKIVRAMPHRRFLLIGRNWEQYQRFNELKALPNFEYVVAKYEDYPALYARMDVFVSVSKLEGGPIPLVESMMSNCVPVASLTGFSRDIIRHGENGYLFSTEAPESEICALIDQAYAATWDVRQSVVHLDWKSFSGKITSSLLTD
jgi:glycosyltransferase involved in cell wall biosynthesis